MRVMHVLYKGPLPLMFDLYSPYRALKMAWRATEGLICEFTSWNNDKENQAYIYICICETYMAQDTDKGYCNTELEDFFKMVIRHHGIQAGVFQRLHVCLVFRKRYERRSQIPACIRTVVYTEL